ncbi:DnaJ domain containing protein [Trichomonas vaginalis G3]|uniref:DnaJ domain containing protein n=1 Tax=Trichomonas vaginalis (strain ATCC PRA-98 / G3) TaxID=412133 RepID=A2DR99_TRIV3|nr:positive regulation of translation initiation in response to endoplasmic reticulum stress [Trichomonas vaginalis G3]EAY17025.1 DnaJ domain containing protein [Trichomonas vaginalis G3]KAI5517888.1 positive regulation of translation initiation in response to endoplasmic reticulum stress [Trichomonas vaginalis G3]|eukprot:XP_001329248.1 DnaJ domain containing protein [Trichomonas vaginalis G3]
MLFPFFVTTIKGINTQMIRQYMQFGQWYAAYQECSNIVNSNKADNEVYLLRAQCAFNLGFSNDTIHDSTKVITYSLKKDEINTAYNLRFHAHILNGDAKNAEADLRKLNDKSKKETVTQLNNLLKKVETFSKKNKEQELIVALDEILKISPMYIHGIYLRTDLAWKNGEMNVYQKHIRILADKYPDDGELQYRYGISIFCNGNTKEGREHIQKIRRKQGVPSNISKIFNSLSSITREFDAANKNIEENNSTNLISSVKRLNKTVLNICPSKSNLYYKVRVLSSTSLRLEGLNQQALKSINSILSENQNLPSAFVERGMIMLKLDDPDAAAYDFRQCLTIDPGNQDAMKGMKQAEELKTKAQRIDLYRLLGVPKTATDEEIKTAFRKLVRKWHPDQFSDKQKKEEAEKMMAAINAAYEVLINPQQRAKIDGNDEEPGVDPFDLFQNQMGGNPFEFLRNINFMFN